MVVKHINANSFDVFFNKGWENWGRFQLQEGKLKQTNGQPVPKAIRLYLEKRYNV